MGGGGEGCQQAPPRSIKSESRQGLASLQQLLGGRDQARQSFLVRVQEQGAKEAVGSLAEASQG